MNKVHSFHIPVMGIGYTIDTPLKVSRFGIDSVISLVDDNLLEKLRKKLCERYDVEYFSIGDKCNDFRAQRITAYLNLINEVAKRQFEEFKNSACQFVDRIKDYIELLQDTSMVKQDFLKKASKFTTVTKIIEWIEANLPMGSIDVNIMTKADKINYAGDEN